jgi:hypothetical protein
VLVILGIIYRACSHTSSTSRVWCRKRLICRWVEKPLALPSKRDLILIARHSVEGQVPHLSPVLDVCGREGG